MSIKDDSLSPETVPRRIVPALELLLESHTYAVGSGSDIWSFAVEIQDLKSAGVLDSDLHWLRSMGYVHAAEEITHPASSQRTFQHDPVRLNLERACFVPTEKGLQLALAASLEHHNSHPRPTYDRDRRELRLEETVVKRFRRPSTNQERVLRVFEEEGWPRRIDDPIPPVYELNPKQRLRDTIKALNRNQTNKLLHFSGDGSGEGIRWTLSAIMSSAAKQRAHTAGPGAHVSLSTWREVGRSEQKKDGCDSGLSHQKDG